ncbi:MAG: hypothetical protein IJS37_03790 [Bacilli bacterium]|nr:hypothetical protein [Bacilli bacterium]
MWKKKNAIKALNWALAISSFVGALLSFILLPHDYWWVGLIVFITAFIAAFLLIYLVLRFKKRHRISGRGSLLIESRYGNILNIKRERRKKSKPVIVIPVNSSFDTIVEDSPSVVDRIVEGTSIHGQWLKKYASTPELLKRVDCEINQFLVDKHCSPISVLTHKRGKQNVYPLGSHVFIERDDYTFLLFALTEFDEHNKVIKKDAEEFTLLMKKLMDITDECAGKHVYIPVMGTKIALFGIDELSSFEYIKNAALNKKCTLRASLSIVIYEDSRDKVSIYD